MLSWSEEDLTDSELCGKLVWSTLECYELYLYTNKLTQMPGLTKYNNFSKLSMLVLDNNAIESLDTEAIPKSTECIWLANNQLNALPDFSKHGQLRCLSLAHNKIKSQKEPLEARHGHVDAASGGSDQTDSLQNITTKQSRYFPPSIAILDLSGNELSEVPYLRDNTNLEELNVGDNQIQSIQADGIPCGITLLNVSNNKITEVPSFQQHTKLQQLLLYGNNLHIIHGLPSDPKVIQGNLTEVQVLGKKCFFSALQYDYLKQRILAQNLVQPPPEVFLQGWKEVSVYFSEEGLIRATQARMVVLGPTEAGKSSLVETLIAEKPVLVLITDRTQVADIKTWNITATDTLQVYDQGGHHIYSITSPVFVTSGCIILLVHDITHIEDAQIEETTDILAQALNQHPDNQIHVVLTHIDKLEEDDITRNLLCIKEKIDKSIDDEIQCLTVSEVSDTQEDTNRRSLLPALQKQKDDMKFFLVSSKTYRGVIDLKAHLCTQIAQKQVSLPQRWIDLYKQISKEKKLFLELTDIENIYSKLQGGNIFRKPKMSQFLPALQYFGAVGLILFFHNIPKLNNYIFHNAQFVINLLKSCFHHDLTNVIDYAKNSKLRSDFEKPEVNLMVRQYQEEGLLCQKLLKFLWHEYGLKGQDQKALVEMMKLFHLCYPIGEDTELLFFPWFVQNNECPQTIDEKSISKIGKKYVSVQLDCVFLSKIPTNAFEKMIVQLQKTAVEKQYRGGRYAWKNGFLVQIGPIECFIIKRKHESTITICVQGDTSELREIWRVMSDVQNGMDEVMCDLHGVIKAIYFLCNHCILKKIIPVQKRRLDEVLRSHRSYDSYVTCNNEEIPRALVIAFSENASRPETDIKEVEKYLEATCRETDPPGKLSYLDCRQVEVNEFELTWGLPLVKGGEDSSETVDPTVTNVVVEYKLGPQWTRVDDVQCPPYVFKGKAEAFRVAAQSQYEIGEFFYVSPCCVIQGDELLSNSDRKQMEVNHESFCLMSNVWAVIVRLYSRGVLTNTEKEQLIRKLQDKSPKVAAELLMEKMYRKTYQELYYFRKTLAETSQIILAKTVPVRVDVQSTEFRG